MIADFVTKGADRTPDRDAIIANGSRLSYRQFNGAIRQAQAAFASALPEDTALAILLLPTGLQNWIALAALRALGVTTVAVNSYDTIHALNLPKDAVLIAGEDDSVHGPLPSGNPFRVVRMTPFDRERIASGPAHEVSPNPAAGDHLLYSSGTTGGQKILPMKAAAEAEVAAERGRFYGFSRTTVFHIANFGVWTAAGFKFPIAVWEAGGCVVIDHTDELYKNFASYHITDAFLLPDMLGRLTDTHQNSAALGTVRFITSGGLLSQSVAARVTVKLSPHLMNIYTSTEVNRTILSATFGGDVALLGWMAPAADAGIEIVDDADMPCLPDQVGTVRIRLRPLDCTGYRGDPDSTAQFFRGGFFYPGDSAVRRSDGRIAILGRTDDVVISGGHKRASGPLEQSIREALNVRAVCIFSGADSHGDERIVIALEADAPPPPAEMRKVADGLGLNGTVSFSVVRRFPYTDNGMNKIRRDDLKRAIFALL